MKKRAIAILLCTSLLLGACGKEDSGRGVREDKEEETEEETEEDEADAGSASGGKTEKPSAQENGEDDPDRLVALPNAPLGEAFSMGSVEHNGSYFVRAGKYVYYRVYDRDALNDIALFGEDYLGWDDPSIPSELWSYDLSTGETECIAEINAHGKIYADVSGLCLAGGNGTGTICVNPEDGSIFTLGAGEPVLVDDVGLTIALANYGNTPYYDIYSGGYQFTISSGEHAWTELLGFAGDRIIALRTGGEEDVVFELLSYDRNGKETVLGEIPHYSYETDRDFTIYPEVEQFLTNGSDVFVTLGYYEGTGHFLNEWMIVSAKAGEAGSLTADVQEWTEETEMYGVEKMYLVGEECVDLADHLPGDIELSGGDQGDLILYTDPEESVVLIEDCAPSPTEGGVLKSIQDSADFIGISFVLLGEGERAESEDIGWRTAYRLKSLELLVIPQTEDGPEAAEINLLLED